MRWPDGAWDAPPRTSPGVLREIACSRLHGRGIEFGPGTSPMPIPLDSEVQFADFLPDHDVIARKSEAAGNDLPG